MDAAPPPHVVKRHHWIVRATHWVNVIALTLMVGSGLRIFNAYPAFARKGESFCCWPWERTPIPAWLTFGGWLAGARNWHFAMMWVLAINGAIYLAFIWLHGEWRDLVPRRGDPRDAWEMLKFYLFIRKRHPHQAKHNALQKGVYFILPWLGVLAVLTGLAIWKPVQLAPLTGLFGGYVWARYWHFLVMLTLVLLGATHVFMVFAVDPASLPSMITGRYDESRSPEARNARPFLRGRPQPVLAISRTASPSASTRLAEADTVPPVDHPTSTTSTASVDADPPAATLAADRPADLRRDGGVTPSTASVDVDPPAATLAADRSADLRRDGGVTPSPSVDVDTSAAALALDQPADLHRDEEDAAAAGSSTGRSVDRGDDAISDHPAPARASDDVATARSADEKLASADVDVDALRGDASAADAGRPSTSADANGADRSEDVDRGSDSRDAMNRGMEDGR